jgi:hypothetical protein
VHDFYAADEAAVIEGADIEISTADMLLGGKSGTVTLSDSLARMGSAKAAGSAAGSAADSPAPAKTPPPRAAADLPPEQAAEFNAWLATRAAKLSPPPSLAPAPAPVPAAPPATPVAAAYPHAAAVGTVYAFLHGDS